MHGMNARVQVRFLLVAVVTLEDAVAADAHLALGRRSGTGVVHFGHVKQLDLCRHRTDGQADTVSTQVSTQAM